MSNLGRIAGIFVLLAMPAWSAHGQDRVRFPDPSAAFGTPPPPVDPYNVPPGAGGATLGPGIQPFDPYAMPGAVSTLPLPPAPPSVPYGSPPPFGLPNTSPYGAPLYPGAPIPGGIPANPYPPPGYGSPYGAPPGAYPGYPGGYPPPYPNTPPMPGTGPWPGSTPVTPGGPANAPPAAGGYGANPYGSGYPYRRLFEHTGFRHTWLPGSEGDELEINETEISTTANFANFLGTTNGLRITPGFAFDFLDGPSPPVTQDLPSRLYAGYLDAGLTPQFSPSFGAELNARVGVYSDFQTFTRHSLRTMGSAVGVLRFNEYYALKLGAAYIDRARFKLLPEAGILWTPNDRMRWNIFFPSPKLSTYWTTNGNTDIWFNLGAEYGGGSWTIERQEDPAAGASERIDINDIRVFAGLEWTNGNRYYGFFEGGYVFDREVVYVVVPEDTLSLKNTFMLRAGISF